MEADRTEEISLGMKLVSPLPEIMPDQADDKIRTICEPHQSHARRPGRGSQSALSFTAKGGES
jgi:hypothetical protein